MIVPCKDEGKELCTTLEALARQPLRRTSWEVLLLVNNSSDDSFDRALAFRRSHPEVALHVMERHFAPEQANIGYVRRFLMDLACERLSLSPKSFSLIASTDADTEVAPDWLAENLAECRNGAEAIGGRITVRTSDLRRLDEKTRRIQMLDEKYRLLTSRLEDLQDPQPHDRWPRHHQHFAASLCVRPDVYQRVGGLPCKESLEDVAFFDALMKHDVRFRHSPNVCVLTSGRLDGKTSIGLAEQLSSWKNHSSKVMAPSVYFLRTLFAWRKELRSAWEQTRNGHSVNEQAVAGVAQALGTPVRLVEEALDCEWFGAAFQSLEPTKRLEQRLGDRAFQPLEAAVRELSGQLYKTTDLPREFLLGISAP